MVIRTQQIKSFEDSLLANFEDEMFQHLREFSPAHSKAMGEMNLRLLIRIGMAKASSYCFTSRGAVRLYLELMFMFGSDFDTDPMYRKLSSPLTGGDAADQMERADRLHFNAVEYSKAVAGPDFQYAKDGFRRARALRYEELTAPTGDVDGSMMKRLRTIYPQKYDYAGETAVREVVAAGRAAAAEYGVSAASGEAVFIFLMFGIGSGFAADPLFPWISGTLTNETIGDPKRRIERLYTKAMTYLDQVLANLG